MAQNGGKTGRKGREKVDRRRKIHGQKAFLQKDSLNIYSPTALCNQQRREKPVFYCSFHFHRKQAALLTFEFKQTH